MCFGPRPYSAYVNFDGTQSTTHPLLARYTDEYLERYNTAARAHNDRLAAERARYAQETADALQHVSGV